MVLLVVGMVLPEDLLVVVLLLLRIYTFPVTCRWHVRLDVSEVRPVANSS
jgi:hypothetical protein